MSDQDQLRQKIDGFMDKLKHGKLSEKGSYAIASSTLSVLRLLVEDSSWNSAQDLMTSVREEGRTLINRCGQTSFSSIGMFLCCVKRKYSLLDVYELFAKVDHLDLLAQVI